MMQGGIPPFSFLIFHPEVRARRRKKVWFDVTFDGKTRKKRGSVGRSQAEKQRLQKGTEKKEGCF